MGSTRDRTTHEYHKVRFILQRMRNAPNEWRIISFELFKKSEGGFYRPFQQCR
jgi:hypothetical protein